MKFFLIFVVFLQFIHKIRNIFIAFWLFFITNTAAAVIRIKRIAKTRKIADGKIKTALKAIPFRENWLYKSDNKPPKK